jgi:hypothetical protein
VATASVSPRGLPLYLLKEGDYRAQAASLSCGQDIAGDGAFSLGMIADYMGSLVSYGAAFYRNLFWEAGLVGHVLYLEAEEAGIRSTGIGCYFDDLVHDVFGISSRDWQSLYHFAVGGPVEDKRLTTLPAYKMGQERELPRHARRTQQAGEILGAGVRTRERQACRRIQPISKVPSSMRCVRPSSGRSPIHTPK